MGPEVTSDHWTWPPRGLAKLLNVLHSTTVYVFLSIKWGEQQYLSESCCKGKLKSDPWGVWVAQLVQYVTLDFRVVESSSPPPHPIRLHAGPGAYFTTKWPAINCRTCCQGTAIFLSCLSKWLQFVCILSQVRQIPVGISLPKTSPWDYLLRKMHMHIIYIILIITLGIYWLREGLAMLLEPLIFQDPNTWISVSTFLFLNPYKWGQQSRQFDIRKGSKVN